MSGDAFKAKLRDQKYGRYLNSPHRISLGLPPISREHFEIGFNMGYDAGRKKALREYFGSLLTMKHPAQRRRRAKV